MIAHLWAIALLNQEVQTAEYKHPGTELVFSYPTTWKFEKFKHNVKLTFPIAESQEMATAEIWSMEFSGTDEIWQASQANAIMQLKHTMTRQWQEEILTVPLLMTRSTWAVDEVGFMSDAGLIYGQHFWKFMYRLTAKSAVFDQADYQWRQVLQSLKTINGSPLKPFDPSRLPSPSETARGPKSFTWTKPPEPTAAPVVGEEAIEASAAGNTVVLRFQKGWKGVLAEEVITFSHPSVAIPLKVRVYSGVDSPAPNRAHFRAGAASLEQLDKVDGRAEIPLSRSKSGMQWTYMWRHGPTAAGKKGLLNAVGVNNELYWIAAWDVPSDKFGHLDRVLEFLQILRIEAKTAAQ